MRTAEKVSKVLSGMLVDLSTDKSLRLVVALALALACVSAVRAQGEIKVVAPDGTAYQYFGRFVVIAGDTMVVGAHGDADKGYKSGSAYVFARNQSGADNWGLVKKLTGSDVAAYHRFGFSMAISGDTMVIGAAGWDDRGISGSAYVFARDLGGADNWGEVKKLTGSDVTAYHNFGMSVAIAGDTIVVGAPRDTDKGFRSGAVYVFARNQGGADNWGEVKKLTASDGAAYDHFGYTVAIAGDTMVVGALGDDDNGDDSGSAYVLARNLGGADNWGELKKLSASDGAAGDYFGHFVAIFGDTIVVGATKDDDNGDQSGSAYVFARDLGGADDWGELKKLTASDGAAGDYFGISVSIAADTIVVGAHHYRVSDAVQGWAYVFARNLGGADNWGEVKKLTASDGAGSDRFGMSVAMTGDTIVVGAPRDDDNGDDSGSVYLYRLNQPPVAHAGGPYIVPEGGSVGLSGSGSDPDGDALTYAWDLDNDGTFETFGQSVAFSAAGLDGPSSQPVGLRVCDDKDACDTSSSEVNITNVAPTVGDITAPTEPVEVDTPIEANASFSDPGTADTHDAEWDWGDGTTSLGIVEESNGSGSVSGSHTYTAAGVYSARLTVTDDDGASGESLFRYAVVYAPQGGFVTGSGWIDSPGGAYTPDPSLTGIAIFGFVSEYRKGATVPSGQTQFQFRVAHLRFRSTGYQWLVIAGPQAKFKGWGTINGSGDYGFMLSAADGQVNGGGGVDKFRIKIWDQATEEVIYDNQMGDADDADATDAIERGRIVIHSE